MMLDANSVVSFGSCEPPSIVHSSTAPPGLQPVKAVTLESFPTTPSSRSSYFAPMWGSGAASHPLYAAQVATEVSAAG